jgi:hypothetical protein
MQNKDNSNTYLSIFKRKGGEGVNTKIVVNDNFKNDKICEDEKALIYYSLEDRNEFLLVTNIKLISLYREILVEFFLSDLMEIKPALFEEDKDNIRDLSLFTRFEVRLRDGNKYILCVEKGEPYNGIYQMLGFIASQNR